MTETTTPADVVEPRNTTAPTENRPEHFDDLPQIELVASLFDVHALDRIAKLPGVLAAVGNLIDTVRAASETIHVDVESTSHIAVTIDRTVGELQLALNRRQQQYDTGRDLYQAWLDDPTGTNFENNRYRWHYYLRVEGITNVGPYVVGDYDL